jgi:hypothetical protein
VKGMKIQDDNQLEEAIKEYILDIYDYAD